MLANMVASMLGISEEEMSETLSGMQTLLKDGVQKLNEIHSQNALILDKLDRLAMRDDVEDKENGNGSGN